MMPVLSLMAGNQDAVERMGDAALRLSAHALLTSLKGSVTVDRAVEVRPGKIAIAAARGFPERPAKTTLKSRPLRP